MDGSDGSHARPKPGRRTRSAAALAGQLVSGEAGRSLRDYVGAMCSDVESTASQAARVVEETIVQQPSLGAPHIGKLVELLDSPHPRVVQALDTALPALGRVAPAKVAKRMTALRAHFDQGDAPVRDVVIKTLIALCAASVAYQRRVLDVFLRGIAEAPAASLLDWVPSLLPILKGEPYAEARDRVEARLPALPAREAQALAEHLGIRLRRLA